MYVVIDLYKANELQAEKNALFHENERLRSENIQLREALRNLSHWVTYGHQHQYHRVHQQHSLNQVIPGNHPLTQEASIHLFL